MFMLDTNREPTLLPRVMRFLLRFTLLVAVFVAPLLTLSCGDGDDSGVTPTPTGVIVVKPDGTGDYATIQAAIDAAADGDTIALADGVFTGEGNRDIEFRGKAVVVISQSNNPDSCVIDCESAGRGFLFYSKETPASVLASVTIRNGFAPSGGGAACVDSSSPSITGCVFTENSGSGAGGGLAIVDQSSPRISHCRLTNNTTLGSGGGIWITESSPSISHCTITDNTRGGISAYSSSPTITNCTIARNTLEGIRCSGSALTLQNTIVAFTVDGDGIVCGEGCELALSCCDIFGNASGDSADCMMAQYQVRGNFSQDPLFCSLETGDYQLQPGSPCSEENSARGQIGSIAAGPCRQ